MEFSSKFLNYIMAGLFSFLQVFFGVDSKLVSDTWESRSPGMAPLKPLFITGFPPWGIYKHGSLCYPFPKQLSRKFQAP